MNFLKDMLSDGENASSMRVMSWIALFIGCYLALTGHDTSVIIFVTAAFGGKLGQKFAER